MSEVFLPPHGRPPAPPAMTHRCGSCGAETPAETMNNFGARCGRCFTSYCRSAFNDAPDDMAVKRGDVSERDYAIARLESYQARHGKPLGKAQRDFLAQLRGEAT